jgi:hypothetical protein
MTDYIDTTKLNDRELEIYNLMFVRIKELEVELDVMGKTNDAQRKMIEALREEQKERTQRLFSRNSGQRVIRKHIQEDNDQWMG